MPRDAIPEQLQDRMNRPPSDAEQLVFAIVKMRKVLEHDDERSSYWALALFCDWVLHTKLDRGGAHKLLELLDQRLGRYDPAHPENLDPDGLVLKILSLDIFPTELLHFLVQHDLPTVWCEDDFAWRKLLVLYGDQVRASPLRMTRKSYPFKYLKELVIGACEPSEVVVKSNPRQRYHGFKWQFTLNDGQTFTMNHTFNVQEMPQGWKTIGARNS